MLRIYEFEIFESEGWFLAFPFDLEGATQGKTFAEACEMAADWLKLNVEWAAMEGEAVPEAKFGHEPVHGGKVVIVAVDAGLETIRRMMPAEAARRLGVTRGRISQMVKAGQLQTFMHEGRTWITQDSVDARLAEQPKPGRPRKDRSALEVGTDSYLVAAQQE